MVNSSARNAAEQGVNGVQTGVGLAKRLDAVASGWKEASRLDVMLLRALCRLTSDRPNDATAGYTSAEIAEAISVLQGRTWSDPTDKERMSDDVRRQWVKLQTTWRSKLEGLHQHATDEGWAVAPCLRKLEGGGTGRPSRYRIEWENQPIQPASQPTTEEQPAVAATDTWIRYVCEDVENPGIAARVFAGGFFLIGWRKWAFLALIALPTLLLLAIIALLLFQLVLRQGLGMAPVANTFVTFVVLFAVFLPTMGALFVAAERKIVIAPWWMQSIYDDRLLEHRSPPRFSVKSLKIARYTATCPVCRGTVTARSGGLEFFGRIVGRCENSPVEHIFSFDHVTRQGTFLR